MTTKRRTPSPGALRKPGQALVAAGAGALRRCSRALRQRPHVSLAATGLIALGMIISLIPSGPEGSPAASVRPLELPQVAATKAAPSRTPDAAAGAPTRAIDDAPADAPAPTPAPGSALTTEAWQIVEIEPGQTLERVFRDLGLGAGLLHEIVSAAEHKRNLARIRPGDRFAFDLGPEADFRALRTELDENAWLIIERSDQGLSTRTEPRLVERRIVEASGTITSSLYQDARQAGLSNGMIMRLASIFGWDIDFALDIRAGDHFALIYEQIWRDGEHLRDGDILAARFVNRGEPFEAVRFETDRGADYFAPDGRPMRKAFLRTPLNFARVSSNFNPRRLHPVTKRVRPHNGTDYAAPTGTPVWAAGDGKVIEAGYTRANGNYVFIQHGNNIITRYLHLSKKAVKRGDRVRQGQVIGQVGATGLATGPHLHYEFLVNGVHRNPRTVDLPPADPLPGEHMETFSRLGSSLLARLDTLAPQPALLARREASSCQGVDRSC